MCAREREGDKERESERETEREMLYEWRIYTKFEIDALKKFLLSVVYSENIETEAVFTKIEMNNEGMKRSLCIQHIYSC